MWFAGTAFEDFFCLVSDDDGTNNTEDVAINVSKICVRWLAGKIYDKNCISSMQKN